MKLLKPLRPISSSALGYTLVEILIVLFIISIVTSVALLTIGRSDGRQVESFANELTEIVTLAEEQAMLQPMVLGLSFEAHAYQFAAYELVGEQKKPSWVPLQDKLLGQHVIPANIELSIKINGNPYLQDEEETQTPAIIISTNGDMTPFTIYVGKKGQKPRYLIQSDGDGNVSKQQLS